MRLIFGEKLRALSYDKQHCSYKKKRIAPNVRPTNLPEYTARKKTFLLTKNIENVFKQCSAWDVSKI